MHSPPPKEATRIAVISDIHANAVALDAALGEARRKGFDHLVILGDLLTYGCAPAAVLDLVRAAVEKNGAHVIRGNHDQLYFDHTRNMPQYYAGLPEWIRESVDWTRTAIGDVDLERRYDWKNDIILDGVFFAHANPFEYGDWTYLNSTGEFTRARAALAQRRQTIGVFGHTHRAKVIEFSNGADECVVRGASAEKSTVFNLVIGRNEILADPGSVGQPRSAAKVSTMMFLTITTAGLDIEIARVDYDVEAHCRTVQASSMSERTKRKLMEFFP